MAGNCCSFGTFSARNVALKAGGTVRKKRWVRKQMKCFEFFLPTDTDLNHCAVKKIVKYLLWTSLGVFFVGIKGLRQDSALIFDPLSSGGKAAPYRWCLGCLLRFISRRLRVGCIKQRKAFSIKQRVIDSILILFWCQVWQTDGQKKWGEDSPAALQPHVRAATPCRETHGFLLSIVVYRAIVPTNITPPTCQHVRGVTLHTAWTRIHYIPQAGRSNPLPLDVTTINLRD